MSTGRNNFTLLEVIVALLILSIGVFFLLAQLALAQRRVADGARDWRETHELVNAAEYLLLTGGKEGLDERFLSPEFFEVKYSLVNAELPPGVTHPAVGKTLGTLQLRLCDRKGTELQQLSIDCFREAADADVKEK